jgi:hypothetical protein
MMLMSLSWILNQEVVGNKSSLSPGLTLLLEKLGINSLKAKITGPMVKVAQFPSLMSWARSTQILRLWLLDW